MAGYTVGHLFPPSPTNNQESLSFQFSEFEQRHRRTSHLNKNHKLCCSKSTSQVTDPWTWYEPILWVPWTHRAAGSVQRQVSRTVHWIWMPVRSVGLPVLIFLSKVIATSHSHLPLVGGGQHQECVKVMLPRDCLQWKPKEELLSWKEKLFKWKRQRM